MLGGVVGALAESVDVLGQRLEAGHLPCEFGESVVGGVGLGLEGHVSPVGVELPDQPGVCAECAWGGEVGGFVCSP